MTQYFDSFRVVAEEGQALHVLVEALYALDARHIRAGKLRVCVLPPAHPFRILRTLREILTVGSPQPTHALENGRMEGSDANKPASAVSRAMEPTAGMVCQAARPVWVSSCSLQVPRARLGVGAARAARARDEHRHGRGQRFAWRRGRGTSPSRSSRFSRISSSGSAMAQTCVPTTDFHRNCAKRARRARFSAARLRCRVAAGRLLTRAL